MDKFPEYNFEFPYPNIEYIHHTKEKCINIHISVIELDHAEELFDLIERNRDHLRKWLPWVDLVKTVNDQLQCVKSFMDKRQFFSNVHRKINNGELLKIDLCCVIKVDDTIVGTCSYNQIIKSSTGHINIGYLGYWIDKKWEGWGVITSAVDKMVEYGLNVANLDHINISVGMGNNKSLKVVERQLGFVQIDSIIDSQYTNGVDIKLTSFIRSKPNALKGWRENRLDFACRDDFSCY